MKLEIIKKGGIGLHMGRYGLILCANESYTNNLAIGTDFDLISAYIDFLRQKRPLRARQNKILAFSEKKRPLRARQKEILAF